MNLKINGTTAFDYELLPHQLLNGNNTIPAALSDALYLVHEMAADDRIDSLLNAARKHNVIIVNNIGSNSGDIAAQPCGW